MNIPELIATLEYEVQQLQGTIYTLRELQESRQNDKSCVKPLKRRGRKFMTQEERAQVSERMKRYWAEKRGAA